MKEQEEKEGKKMKTGMFVANRPKREMYVERYQGI